ncbi:NACHT and WD repeat domain-containing 2 isoform X1 [Chlorella sorokiniana]|uniref:NACHT and WD repeat domain-containing 2 isoform X1 n=1 Tax=Chlorella sorokiniana TaxID=3076 RepID=A0A2P6TVW5_CHLSO|nr:NACHT and WD repeat domain-containing 2 isoform X1 [Chlorella sorokiniana]|eukprot:PRW58207.1 NACHT and WD repeat domain-containing 2 isoform X1 [Chlorella sorokiniana]
MASLQALSDDLLLAVFERVPLLDRALELAEQCDGVIFHPAAQLPTSLTCLFLNLYDDDPDVQHRVPHQLSTLTKLRHLTLQFPQCGSDGYAALQPLTRLTRLTLEVEVHALPSCLTLLTLLRDLRIYSWNKGMPADEAAALADHLPSLRQLTRLDVVVARAISLLQDDGLLLSPSVRLLLVLYALCWDDHGTLALSAILSMPTDWSRDWLQERIGLHMLLRWAASFLLPAWPRWASGGALRALAFCLLCTERWGLHCELLNAATLDDTSMEACQPLLSASRQVAGEFGCFPLHAVRRLLYNMSPQAAPHLAGACLRPPAVSRMYALTAALELASQARSQEGHAGIKYMLRPHSELTPINMSFGEYATMLLQFKQLPSSVDVASLQVAFGGLPMANRAAGYFLSSRSDSCN